MAQIVIMVEEPSMEIIAKSIAERLGLKERSIVIPHQGKSDLEKSFPKNLSPRFVICRDNDGGDCMQLKARLLNMVPNSTNHPVKFRIVVQELESWYLGDLLALEKAGLMQKGNSSKLTKLRKFKKPESLTNAKQELHRLVGKGGQLKLARQIAPYLDLEQNASYSFNQFVFALKWAATV
jgi:Domain of unknown function (DUF4276)